MSEDLSVLTRSANPADLTLAYGNEADQVADIRYGTRGSELPLLVLIHGGFWKPEYDRAHVEAMSTALAEAGWTTLTLEYRRVSGKPDVTLQDIATALASLPARVECHNGQILLVGHSAGGHLVLWAAAQNIKANIRGVLALAPAADLQMAHAMNLGDGAVQRFLGENSVHRPDLNPMCLPAPSMAVTILQGDDDEIVPLAVSASYCAAFPNTRLVSLADCGHFALIDPASAAWGAVLNELRSLK
jgi:pimeloyl-ACP methyl ester carboxylesterase